MIESTWSLSLSLRMSTDTADELGLTLRKQLKQYEKQEVIFHMMGKREPTPACIMS